MEDTTQDFLGYYITQTSVSKYVPRLAPGLRNGLCVQVPVCCSAAMPLV